MRFQSNRRQIILTLAWDVLLAYFFAEIEIAIEGGAGWAANLPTWRIENTGCWLFPGAAG